MLLKIRITDRNGNCKASAEAEGEVRLVYLSAYEEGDEINLESDVPGDILVQLEDSIAPFEGYLKAPYRLIVPFDEKKISYSPKSFSGEIHLLWAREATGADIYRNIALNPLDSHHNVGLFPHALANVETRGESVFAARNAINGNTTSAGHGAWPYESWGINRQDDAEIRIDFGRLMCIDKAVITLRADFPHDNWWKRGVIRFSDGSSVIPELRKSGLPQSVTFAPRTVEWATLGELIKDEDDPSPFPALIQIEFWGKPYIAAES